MSANINVVIGDWNTCKAAAAAIRHAVFVQEQRVPVELEMDNIDPECVHAVAYNQHGLALGTGRLLPDGHIGRMAVQAGSRGQGVGSMLLQALVDEARLRNYLEVVLSAQLHAQDFYARHGFVAEGGVYMDAGIEHITMRHALTA
ncbi:GNAT family N-acetyltransferase [Pusillimonas sp. MFBS29]|uniref:GNAT family N-acetyltransferase n=1 Tax=Pusillimonas sp. MFBS29 TaxID=2886690 RepID=UPI001D0FB9A1|nr:GNAT family N-acetyltransferase [Pusillimonas sp. MFBS29]